MSLTISSWATLTASSSLFVEDWMSPPAAELPRDLAAEHLGLRSTILHALQSGEPVVAKVRGRGFSPDLLRLFAR